MFSEFSQQMQYQGIDIDTHCKYLETTPADIKKNYEKDAKNRVATRLLLEAVAEAEKIEVTPEEVENELESLAKEYGMEKDKIKESFGDSYLKMLEKDVARRKAIDLVYAEAKLTEPKKKAEKKPAAKKTAAKKTSKKAEAAEEAPAAGNKEE